MTEAMMASKPVPLDDLEAVRSIVTALEPFDPQDRERIVRWACEKLGIALLSKTVPGIERPPAGNEPGVVQVTPPTKRDLRTFVAEKAPSSDIHFATVVAYYYQFEAPESERKNAITPPDLTEACRLADRTRLQNPGQTLRNAVRDGLLDRPEPGAFRINTVGENLVAMTLPTGTPRRAKSAPKTAPRAAKRTGATRKQPARKAVRAAPKRAASR